MKNETRFNEVTCKLKAMFSIASEAKKDEQVKVLKSWAKNNANDNTGKREAIQCFLAEQNIY